MAFSYSKVTVDKPTTPSPGIGSKKLEKIIIFDLDDVSSFPGRDADGVQISNSIIMKNNTKMISVYGTVNTIKTGSTSEGDPDSEGFVHQVEFEHPGNTVEIRAFKTGWLGKNAAILITNQDNPIGRSLFGEPGCPMRMQVKQEDSKDKNSNVFTFKMMGKSIWDVGYYKGSLTMDKVLAPKGVKDTDSTVNADATSINISSGYNDYYLTDGTSAAATITTCTGARAGQIFSLVGSGGDHPSTITGGDFLLASGLTWTALEDSTITFQAFVAGENSWKFIELGRT